MQNARGKLHFMIFWAFLTVFLDMIHAYYDSCVLRACFGILQAYFQNALALCNKNKL